MTRVVVNGTFDILHVGHVKLLERARSYVNSQVLVLIDSDSRVKELKGSNRPINNEYERKTILESLKSVDQVKIFSTDEELIKFIKDFEPDIMVKGSDYKDKPIIGAEYCRHIEFYDRIEQYSTTKKIYSITSG